MTFRRWRLFTFALLAAAIQFASPAIGAEHAHEEEGSSHDASTCQVCHIVGSVRNIDTPTPAATVRTELIFHADLINPDESVQSITSHRIAQPRAPPIA